MYAPAAAILFLAGLAAATPVPEASANQAVELHKRAAEGLHLVNCYIVHGGYQSEMFYFKDDSKAQGTGSIPDDTAFVGDGKSFVKWEGQAVTGTFSSTGAKFTSHINGDAASKSTGTYVGTGYNGSNWKCYKDSNRLISGNGAQSCYSVYYCLK